MKLIELRIRSGLSQRALAKKCGLSSTYISQLESGDRAPSPRAAKVLCEALGVDFDTLFTIEPRRVEEASA
ncbi:MAG: helix-turn-helix domain-containing protein [Bacillota bacterium]